MPTYKHPIDIGWNNGYRILQLIDFCKYLILPSQYKISVSFNSQAILIVIANMFKQVIKKYQLLLEQFYEFGKPLRKWQCGWLVSPRVFPYYGQRIIQQAQKLLAMPL